MNIKNGLVMEIQGNAAYIMTSSGEFFKIKIDKNKTLPILGGEYSSKIFENPFMCISKFKYAVAACLLFFMLSLGGGTYAYYTPISTVTININPSIEFKLNRWSRVLSSNPLNSDGEKILLEIKTKNKPIDDALIMVIDQAKQDKYINDNYTNMGKTITINIVGKEIGLPSLQKELSKDNVNVRIDSNGKNIYNKNDKKLDNVSPKNNSDKNTNVSTNANSGVNKSAIDKNNSNVNVNNKTNKVLGNTGESNNTSNDKYNNGLGNDNKKDNNNSNLGKSDGKLDKDKIDNHHDSDKEDKNDNQDNNGKKK
jgi:hypothetical protein